MSLFSFLSGLFERVVVGSLSLCLMDGSSVRVMRSFLFWEVRKFGRTRVCAVLDMVVL